MNNEISFFLIDDGHQVVNEIYNKHLFITVNKCLDMNYIDEPKIIKANSSTIAHELIRYNKDEIDQVAIDVFYSIIHHLKSPNYIIQNIIIHADFDNKAMTQALICAMDEKINNIDVSIHHMIHPVDTEEYAFFSYVLKYL